MNRPAMTSERLSALLGATIVPTVLELSGVHDAEGVNAFYASELYSLLSDAQTGLWHLSPVALAAMYADELAGEPIIVPEEQS